MTEPAKRSKRGTRPTGPQRWPQDVEDIRRGLEGEGRNIVGLVRDVEGTTNVYKQKISLAQIAVCGERIEKLALSVKTDYDIRLGREAESIRREIEETGSEITKLAREARTTPNMYLRDVRLAELELYGERVEKLAKKATIGYDPNNDSTTTETGN